MVLNGQVIRGHYMGVAGARDWRLYVPSGYRAGQPTPLLVMLHGCTQNADDIARGTRFDAVAESRGWLVLYPEQPASANPRTCWNWFDAAHHHREAGEPSLIAGMVDEIAQRYSVDAQQIHIAGVSAGAAMAGLVAVAYPERFATLSSASGVAWGASATVMRALTVMANGAGADVPSAAQMVSAMGAHATAIPTLVIHGESDAVVSPKNARETSAQWVGVHNQLRAARGESLLSSPVESTTEEQGYTAHRTEWRDADGNAAVVQLLVKELGHAWSGGSSEGSFTDPKGPDASLLIASFGAQHPRSRR